MTPGWTLHPPGPAAALPIINIPCRLTVLDVGEPMHERQPHQTLRGRVRHQRVQESVEGDLFLRTGERAGLRKHAQQPQIRSDEPSPAARNTSWRLARCSWTKVPQKRPLAVWELPSETGQTASAPLHRRSPKSARKYLETTRADITPMKQANCLLPPRSANYSVTQWNYPSYLGKHIKVKQSLK